jgi:SnoaL-like protein
MRVLRLIILAAGFLSMGNTSLSRGANASSSLTTAERMMAEHDCTKLQMEYGVFADHGDVEGYVGLFAPDATINVPGHPIHVGLEEIRASIKQVIARGTWRHVETNSVINVIDANTAKGVVYSTVYSDAAPWNSADLLPVRPPYLIGEYEDIFEKTSAGWRFRSRLLKLKFGTTT